MPYTVTQLNSYYQSLTGTAPVGADAVLINASATQSQAGTQSDVNTLLTVFNSAGVQATFEVVEGTYQFFTGSGVTQAGLNFLEGNAGSGNANGLNTAFYTQFNTENRYYNFAINLASTGGAGNSGFVATYGSLTFAQTVATAYETIVGSSNVGTAAANAAIADITSRQAFFTSVAQQRAGGVDAGGAAGLNIALKAIVVGYILEEANKADVGTYAKAIDQLEAAVSASATVGGVNSPFGSNIVQTFGASGSGFNSGFTALGANGNAQTNFALTTGIDAPNLTTGSVQYIGTVNINGNGSNVVNPSTLQAGDQVRATGANNTLTVTTVGTVADASGGAVITGVQTINVRAAPDPQSGGAAGATISANTLPGATAINAYLSLGPVTINALTGSQSTGIINDGLTTGAALTANYVASATSATVNLAGGTTAGETVTLNGTGLVTENVNSNGGLNRLATLAAPASVTTLNLSSTSPLTVTTTTANALQTLTASGSGTVNLGATAIGGGGANTGTVTAINTSNLTSTGALIATFNTTATAATYTLGAGSDILTFNGDLASGTNLNTGGGTNSITVTGSLVGTATIIGGTSADTITVQGNLSATSVINAGGGGDTVQVGTAIGGAATTVAGASINGGGSATLVTDAANFTSISTGFSATNRALITGFSTVAIDDALANGVTYDVNAIGAQNFTSVGVATGGTATLNAASGAVVTLTDNLGGFGGGTVAANNGTLNISLAGALANTNDTLNLGYINQGQSATSTIVANGVENVLVTENLAAGVAATAAGLTLNLTDAVAKVVSFSGSEAIFFAPAATFAQLNTITSTTTGQANIDVHLLNTQTAANPVNVTTGAGVDYVGVGDYTRVMLGGGAVNFVEVYQNTSGNSYSSVLDASATTRFSFVNAATSVNATKIALNATAVFQDYLDAASAGNGGGRVSTFDYQGNTYLVEDNNAAATFQNGSDDVIQLVGIHTVSGTLGAAVAATATHVATLGATVNLLS